jgi:hypothetical protein
VLSNTYHGANERGFAPAAKRVGYAVIADIGFELPECSGRKYP